jgi:hypothetical protein
MGVNLLERVMDPTLLRKFQLSLKIAVIRFANDFIKRLGGEFLNGDS